MDNSFHYLISTYSVQLNKNRYWDTQKKIESEVSD